MKVLKTHLRICAALLFIAASGAACVSAQKTSNKPAANQQGAAAINVKQIDFPALKAILRENAEAKRPLLVNFWATWCPPCREEFPELVKIDQEFRPKNLEFVTVSLDDLADKDTDVTQFLREMRAGAMPAFLLKTSDEEAAIHSIAPEWRGALPLTVLYDKEGKAVYTKMGAIKPDVLRAEIGKVLDSIADNNAVILKRLLNSDDPHGFIFSIVTGRKVLRPQKPNALPIITSITITKNQ